MKRVFTILLLILLTSIILASALPQEMPGKQKRETFLDRKVHIEKELIMDIPQVTRWCARLDLIKRRVNVGDCELYMEEEGQGIPLVIINGGPGGTHHYFHPIFSRAKEFARVIYYDQRGCGLSGYEKGDGYTVEQAVDDLDNLREAINIEKWVVLGHSYGGFLAKYYAVNYPDKVAGLVLVNSGSLSLPSNLITTTKFDYLSKEERERMKEISRELHELYEEKKISWERYMELLVYNLNLNGNWKLQHYYKPSLERMAQDALYEAKSDVNFNSIMSKSWNKVNLRGVFDKCPIPTLIIEDKWDLIKDGLWDVTWDADVLEILQSDLPGAKVVIFEHSSHDPFSAEPERFFPILKNFLKGLPEISEIDLTTWRKHLIEWKEERKKQPVGMLESYDWDYESNKRLVREYSREWLKKLIHPTDLLKTGFALYDFENYEEALLVFKRLCEIALEKEDRVHVVMALIWQGHMLDLMGRRDEAITVYKRVVDMNVTGRWEHSQYGMTYSPSIYAAERIKESFKRIENRTKNYD